MYTYDSATNLAHGPDETDTYYTWKKSLTLVSGKPGSISPMYGLVNTAGSFGVLDLSLENYGCCTSYGSEGRDLFRVDDLIQAPKPDPPECLESCTQGKAMAVMLGSTFGGIAVVLICCPLTLAYCLRKRRRQRELVIVVGTVAVTSNEMALDTRGTAATTVCAGSYEMNFFCSTLRESEIN